MQIPLNGISKRQIYDNSDILPANRDDSSTLLQLLVMTQKRKQRKSSMFLLVTCTDFETPHWVISLDIGTLGTSSGVGAAVQVVIPNQ